MAQKKDKSRKQKLEKYKKSKKMSEAPEMKPFRQVPVWQSNETFEIQGSELESLYNFFSIFTQAFGAVNQVFARGVQSGKIKTEFEYADGTPVPAEQVAAYTKKLNEYFKQSQKGEDPVPDETQEPVAKIVNMHGVKANEDNV
jgi:hypothetical protein